MFEYNLAYLALSIVLLPIWIFLFIYRKDLRHKIIFLSLIVGMLGLLSHLWYLKDYWQPINLTSSVVGIEDFLFGFLMGGIGSVIYEELFSKSFNKRKYKEHSWPLFFVIFIGISVLVSNILFLYFGLNSIYASLVAFFLLSAGMLIFRRDLIIDAITSGVILGLLLFLSYLILLIFFPLMFDAFWQLDNLSGLAINRIPIEEILWAFGLGMVLGPLYEFYSGISIGKIKRK